MSETLTADKGEQLTATFAYPTDITGKVATFVVRGKAGDPDPSLLTLSTEDVSPTDGTLTLDAASKTVTLKIHGPTTLDLPSATTWAMWLNAGEDDAEVISGSLRLYEVVQP